MKNRDYPVTAREANIRISAKCNIPVSRRHDLVYESRPIVHQLTVSSIDIITSSKMMIEDLDSVFEDSPYNARKYSPAAKTHHLTHNGSSVPSNLHLTLTPECPLGVSDSGKCQV